MIVSLSKWLSHYLTFLSINFLINWLSNQLTFINQLYSSLAQLIITFKRFSLVWYIFASVALKNFCAWNSLQISGKYFIQSVGIKRVYWYYPFNHGYYWNCCCSMCNDYYLCLQLYVSLQLDLPNINLMYQRFKF